MMLFNLIQIGKDLLVIIVKYKVIFYTIYVCETNIRAMFKGPTTRSVKFIRLRLVISSLKKSECNYKLLTSGSTNNQSLETVPERSYTHMRT